MEKLLKLLQSRTFWTVIVLFIINGVSAIEAFIPAGWQPAVNGVLGILALYFRANPRVEF